MEPHEPVFGDTDSCFPMDFLKDLRRRDVILYVAAVKSVPSVTVVVGQKGKDGRTVFSAQGRFPELFRRHDHADLDEWISKRPLALYRMDGETLNFSFLNEEDEVFFALLMSEYLIILKETGDA